MNIDIRHRALRDKTNKLVNDAIENGSININYSITSLRKARYLSPTCTMMHMIRHNTATEVRAYLAEMYLNSGDLYAAWREYLALCDMYQAEYDEIMRQNDKQEAGALLRDDGDGTHVDLMEQAMKRVQMARSKSKDIAFALGQLYYENECYDEAYNAFISASDGDAGQYDVLIWR